MPEINPMDIPEIVRYIAQFLDTEDLASAAAVSRAWNANFSQYLYENLKWYDEAALMSPTCETIQNHANDVRSLILRDNPPTHFPSHALTRLRDIRVSADSWDNDIVHHLVTLLGHNPALRSFRLDMGPSGTTPASDILPHLTNLQGLREVRISGLEFSPEDVITLFDVCSRLETLRLLINRPSILQPENWPQISLAVQNLYFDDGTAVPLHIQSEIIQRCPQLRRLTVYIESDSHIHQIQQICNNIRTHCTHLRDLSISWRDRILTNALDPFLRSCDNLNSLHLLSTGYVYVTYDALRPHFHSLTSLDTRSCGGFSSTMLQDIMAGCPLLKTLRGPILDAKDFIDEGEIADLEASFASDRRPRDWVCLGLETFSVYIIGCVNDSYHRLIFQRLAKLTRLVVLDVGTLDNRHIDHNMPGLRFRIDHGVDALVSLRRLRWLRFTGVRQQMDMADIQWMLRSWPHLERVSGHLNTDPFFIAGDLRYELDKRFIKRDTA